MPLGRQPTWVTASLIGVGGIAVITIVFGRFLDDVAPEISALLLLLLITTVSVMSSWRVGVPIALGRVANGRANAIPIGCR